MTIQTLDIVPPRAMSLAASNLAMAALTMTLMVAVISNLMVLTSLPRISADLGGSQASYTWVITTSMLVMTVTMPIWGRLSDLIDKKRAIQSCTIGYVCASMVAGFAWDMTVLIVCRAAIGLCAAGIIVLIQTISVEVAEPRHRARWVGYRSVVMTLATVGAPLVGGILTERLGWRACFFFGVPFAILAVVMVQRVLHLEVRAVARRRIDWLGAVLIAGGLTLVMLWISVAGPARGFVAPIPLLVLAGGGGLLAIAAVHEIRTPHAILPLALLRQRAVILCSIGGAAAGMAMFGIAVFITLYLQVARGLSPSEAGAMALPEAAGAVLGSVIGSRIVSRTGFTRGTIVTGAAMICVGFAILTTIGTHTPLLLIAASVALIGGGLGLASENMTLVVQTSVARDEVGLAGSIVSFARMLGGILCVAAMGSLLSYHVGSQMAAAGAVAGPDLPDPARLSPMLRGAFMQAYAEGAGLVYWCCFGAATVLLVSVLLLPKRSIDPA